MKRVSLCVSSPFRVFIRGEHVVERTEELIHALHVPHIGVELRIDEEDVCHGPLYGLSVFAVKPADVRVRPGHILDNRLEREEGRGELT